MAHDSRPQRVRSSDVAQVRAGIAPASRGSSVEGDTSTGTKVWPDCRTNASDGQAGQGIRPGRRWYPEVATELPRTPGEWKLIGRLGGYRDPFEGRSAHRRELRLRIEGIVALSMAIAACGLTLAVWVKTLVPLFGAFLG